MLISWKKGVDGDFATASNWNPGAIPGPADDVSIAVPGTYTVISSFAETVDGLNLTDKHATLSIQGTSSFTTETGGVNDGTILVDQESILNVGTFGESTTLLNFGQVALSGGTLFGDGAATLSNDNVISGTGTIEGFASIENSGNRYLVSCGTRSPFFGVIKCMPKPLTKLAGRSGCRDHRHER